MVCLIKVLNFKLCLLSFIALSYAQASVVHIEANPDAKRLYDDLLSNYNRLIRPVVNNTETLTVWLGLKLSQLIEVSLRNQVMTTNLWVKQKWNDYKLKWDPEEYGGVEMLYVPSEQIWLPDIVLYNNWDGNYEVTLMTKATLKYTGEVFWEPPAIYKSSCEMNVEYFPYDEQTCLMKFGSWTYNGAQVELRHLDQVPGSNLVQIGIDLSEFYLSVEWDILEVPASRNEEYYPCCPEPFSDITFKLTMRRKTLFYTVNLIIPCVGITFLTVLVFYLPSDSGEKVTLCISILVSLTVFFLLLAEIIPPTSLAVPLLGKYLLFTMILVSLSVWTTVCVLNVWYRSTSTHKMSPIVKRLFLEIMPKIMMMRRAKYTLPEYDDSMGNGYTNEIEMSISDFPGDFKEGGDSFDNIGMNLPHGSVDNDNVIPKQLSPELLSAIQAVRFIAQHIKDADKDNEVPKRRHSPYRSGREYNYSKRSKTVRNIETREDNGFKQEEFPVYNIADEDDEFIKCRVGGVEIEMLIDSGSTYNLIDDTTWELLKLGGAKYSAERFDDSKRFLAYGRVPLKLLTVFDAVLDVMDGSEVISTETTFYVIEGGQQPLLGKVTARNLGLLQVGLPSTFGQTVSHVKEAKIFPKIKDFQLVLPIDRCVPPVIQPLRRCPIPILGQVKAKLDELHEMGIIERVTRPTSWVSPLVPIMKDNGELRLCVDMRRANQAIQRLNHPLPVFEDLLSRFGGAKYFTTLDIKQAFHQVELADESRDITTFITNWGLYRYTRLLFGVNYAPEFFQNLMESILAECSHTVVFIDDIVVWGLTEKEHDDAVKQTLAVLNSHGLALNVHKCKFKRQEIQFLGHKLSATGVLPSDDKIKSISGCRPPRNKEELRSFLGLVTYVSRFIPNLSTASHPLRELLKSSSNFQWSTQHNNCFQTLKSQIGNLEHLGYYDPKDQTILVTDASGVGLGAVLVQLKENLPRVISYASRSLSETEQRYPPIEKEALGIVWGVERFKIYLMGISFTLETDHRPLEVLFTSNSRPTARIERWMLRLQAFRFRVVYRKGSSNIADTLSRLASHIADQSWDNESEVYIRRAMATSLAVLTDELEGSDYDEDIECTIRSIQETAAIDISEVAQATENDSELQAVKLAIMTEDWSSSHVKQYSAFRSELSYANKIVMRGTKLIIPRYLRSRMLMLAHEGHPGQSSMKRRLRDRCWWPNMDQEAIKVCEKCEGCRLVQVPDPPEPMQRRPLPDKPWVDIAIDFLGPLPSGEYILVVIDYFSRHVDLEILTTITAKETIKRLDKIFRLWGIPRTITLDNAKQFVSTEFEDYSRTKGIILNHTSPYWPQANGEVERQNRSLLKRLKIANALYGTWRTEMDRYLEMYNNTPHTTTGKAPNELLQNRKLRSKFPELDDVTTADPSTDFADRDKVQKISGKEREDNKRRAKSSDIAVGDVVLMRNLHPTNKLSTNFLKEKFVVEERNGSNISVKSLETGKSYERNVSHLKRILDSSDETEEVAIAPSDPDSGAPRPSERLRKSLR